MYFVTEGTSHRGKSSADTARFHDGRSGFVCVGGHIESFGDDRGNAVICLPNIQLRQLIRVLGSSFMFKHKPIVDSTIGGVAKEVQARWIGRFPLTFLSHPPHGKLNPGHILRYKFACGFKDYADVEHSMTTMEETFLPLYWVFQKISV
jgi:hypothetical protein